MTTCAEWETMLGEAKAALHTLHVTGAVQSLQSGEKQITFGRSNINDLRGYIAMLQAKVDACNGNAGRRAIRFMPLDG